MADRNVVVYTQDGCMFCKKVKEFLAQKGVPFIERNVTKDTGAASELNKLGFIAIPVTIIDGKAVAGFDPKQFEQLLNK